MADIFFNSQSDIAFTINDFDLEIEGQFKSTSDIEFVTTESSIYIEGEFESTSDIEFISNTPEFYNNVGEFNSNTAGTFGVSSFSLLKTINFNSQSDIVINIPNPTIQATNLFNSISDIEFDTNNFDLEIEGQFNSTSDIEFVTNISNIYLSKEFNSNTNIFTATSLIDLVIQNQFTTTSNIEFDTSEFDLNIIGTSNVPINNKKLQYISDSLIADHVKYYYPAYSDLIKSFLKYLDLTTAKSTLNILNNNNINHVYDEFVDNYLHNFFNEVIDLNKYGLTTQNKKRFLQLSRILNNLKGNKKSFDFLFRSFTDIRIAQEDIELEVDKIVTEYLEDESWWIQGVIKYYDATYTYDGTIDHTAPFGRPFTYQFKVDQSLETMIPLIRSVHPAGFNYEFLFESVFSDDQQIEDIAETTVRYYYFYNFGGPTGTGYLYDGSINYSEYRDEVTIF